MDSHESGYPRRAEKSVGTRSIYSMDMGVGVLCCSIRMIESLVERWCRVSKGTLPVAAGARNIGFREGYLLAFSKETLREGVPTVISGICWYRTMAIHHEEPLAIEFLANLQRLPHKTPTKHSSGITSDSLLLLPPPPSPAYTSEKYPNRLGAEGP